MNLEAELAAELGDFGMDETNVSAPGLDEQAPEEDPMAALEALSDGDQEPPQEDKQD